MKNFSTRQSLQTPVEVLMPLALALALARMVQVTL